MRYVSMLTNYRLIRLQEETLLKFRKVSSSYILYFINFELFEKKTRLKKFYD